MAPTGLRIRNKSYSCEINQKPIVLIEQDSLRRLWCSPARLALLSILLFWNNQVSQVRAHGTLVDPVSRNSLWRIDSSAPVNYNDIELFCGGIGVVTQMDGKCGLCGDAYNLRTPRPHETGGFMVTNRTVKNYFPHSTMDVVINLDTNHGGYFEFELCRRQSFNEPETETCFEPLKFIDGSRRMRLRADHSDRGLRSVALLMPEDLQECRACILRWNYRAGNNWGVCQDGSQGIGCGPQELYRNCADISIGYFQYQSQPEPGAILPTALEMLLIDSGGGHHKSNRIVEEPEEISGLSDRFSSNPV